MSPKIALLLSLLSVFLVYKTLTPCKTWRSSGENREPPAHKKPESEGIMKSLAILLLVLPYLVFATQQTGNFIAHQKVRCNN